MLFSICIIILRVPRALGECVFTVSSKNQCKYSIISIMYKKEKKNNREGELNTSPPIFLTVLFFLVFSVDFRLSGFLTFICEHVSLTHVFTDFFTYCYCFIGWIFTLEHMWLPDSTFFLLYQSGFEAKVSFSFALFI